jgi:hypothetical protein
MWVLGIPSGDSDKTPYTGTAKSHAIIKGGYLMRTARIEGDKMHIKGDLMDPTLNIAILGGAPEKLATLSFNGQSVEFKQNDLGVVTTQVSCPEVTIPPVDLNKISWKSIDSLPELQSDYSDEKWTVANLKNKTYNTAHPLRTPVSLYGSDYGYHLGYHLFRGTFKASGEEKKFSVHTRGGLAYAHSVWIGDTFLGSWKGNAEIDNHTMSHNLADLEAGKSYTFTIVIDNMGHDQNWHPGMDESKAPIGILDYTLSGREKDAISWKLTGNFGGEDYPDRVRGPTNEGGLFAERQGYHLPNPPTNGWKTSMGGPVEGLKKAGISFYTTTFDLHFQPSLDIPTAISIQTSSKAQNRPSYRLQIYVNGWQFGKYVHDIGPQTKFPFPPGIWNYSGKNTVAVTFWNLEDQEVKVESISLVHGPQICTGMEKVKLVESPSYSKRDGAY